MTKMFDNRNTSKIGSIALVMVLGLAAVGLAFSGGVSATDSDSTILVHSETAIDNSTDSVYADVVGADDMNASGPIAVDVTVTGLADGQDVANGTVLLTESLSVSAGSVSSSSYVLSDTERETYSSVHVEINVVTDGEETHIASTDWGVLEQVSGGGGFLSGGVGSIGGVPIVLVVLAVGGYFVVKD